MNRKLIITNYQEGIAEALYADGKAVELFYESRQEQSLLGNIYVGKVMNIAKNIQAAFVEIEDRVACYYSLTDNPDPLYVNRKKGSTLAAGDEILVQVSRENVKSKAPTVTSNLSFVGKYLILTTGKKRIGASAKLSCAQRERLTELAASFADPRYGWIIRTNAAGATQEELTAEAKELSLRYVHLYDTAFYRPCRSCLYRSPSAWMEHVRDFYDSEYDEILTDNAQILETLQDYLRPLRSAMAEKLRLYTDPLLPLDKKYALENAFAEAAKERIWLKSGAYLIIQPTEALTVIDVNTGKYERGKAKEETFFKINTEAAREIARQIRLRNLSGIILIDFINMEAAAQQQALLQFLGEELRKDPVKACVVDMTRLGLVEVTRKRVRRPLAELMGKTGNPA